MRKRFIYFIMLIMLFTCLNYVSAATMSKEYLAGTGDNIQYWMQWRGCTDPTCYDPSNGNHIPNGLGSRIHNYNVEQYVIDGSKRAYCLEIHVHINEGPGFNTTTDWNKYAQKYGWDTTNYIQKVMYYGYGYNGDNSVCRFMAAQELIWERECGSDVISMYFQPWVNYQNVEYIPEVESYKNEITNLINNHQNLPSFSGHTFDLDYKNTLTITDYNSKLNKYYISDNGGLNAKIEGNKLVIGSDAAPGEHVLRLTKNPTSEKATLVYKGEEQMLGYPGDSPAISAEETYVKVRILSGKITVKKLDDETGSVPQGDATLVGAKYNIKDDRGVVVDTLTIGNSLTATSKSLPLGTYTVVESQAPTGYNLSNEEYTVTLSVDNPDVTIEDRKSLNVDEVIKRNDIEIIKDIGQTASTDQTSLSGCEFTATLKSSIGTDHVFSKKCEAPTDGNGYCIIRNLPYGTYVVEETTVSPMAMKCANFEVFVGEDKSVRVNPYTPSNGNFLPTTLGETDGTTKDYPASYDWLDDNGHIVDVPKVMKIKIVKMDSERTDENPVDYTQGDAHLEGARYSIYRDEACTDKVETLTIARDADGSYSATSGEYLVGRYYVKEDVKETVNGVKYSYAEGYLVDEDVYIVSQDPASQNVEITSHSITSKEKVIRNDIPITKYIEETETDAKVNLSGAVFKAVRNSDNTDVYYSTVTNEEGECVIEDMPYGWYTISESTLPPAAFDAQFRINDTGDRIKNFEVYIQKDQTDSPLEYEYTDITDVAKKMKIEINKHIVLREGEATDAVLNGAIFTLYKDEECTAPYMDKEGNAVTVGPTDENGYAISKWMKTGKYYMKETTFPTGIDPDATIPGEGTTYRNKVYVVGELNSNQTEEFHTYTYDINNEPNRNHIEILKEVGETSNTPQFPLDKCEFTATLKSTIGTDHVFSRKCTAETRREDGYCIIEDLPYGTYVIEETKVSPITLKCANFEVFVQKDKKVKKIPYAPADGNFLTTTLGETIGTTKDYPTSYEWVDDEGKLVDVPKVMQLKIRKVDYDRTDVNPVDYTQGDAVLKGAIYQIYRYDPVTDDFTEYVYDITVDHQDKEGYWCAESRELLVGDYMVKEKIQKTEVGKDGETYNYSYAEGYLVDPNEYYFRQNPEEQTVRKTFQKAVSKEKVIRGSVKVIKYDNKKNNSSQDTNPSTEVASKGAILRLVLNSSVPKDAVLEEGKETDYYKQGTIWYEVKIDGSGAGQFLDTNDDMHTTAVKTCYGENYYDHKIADIDGKYNYSCTIPYGDYTVIETRESDSSENTSFYVKPENVNIEKSTQIEYRIEADDPVPMYLKIQKRDKDTGATVAIEGATFKIWDIKNKEFITQLSTIDHEFISEFVTSEDGLLTTPEQLLAGEYIIYEIKAPSEYYLEDELRLPKDPNDIGVVGKGGKHVVIDKTAMEIKQNTISNTLDYFYTVDMSDRPLVTVLEIIKKGEMLTSTRSETIPYGEKNTPVYEMRGLKDVTYEIYAAEDIKSPDGRETYVTNGTKVDTITTDGEGIARTKELYPGEYRIVETITPLGYVKDTNIPNVVLESSHDELVRVKTTKKDLTNIKQKTKVYVEKKLEKTEYDVPKDMIKVVVGLYSNKEIKDYTNNTTLLNKGTLVDVLEGTIKPGETLELVSDVNLPFGDYYAKELYVDYPYEMDTEKQVFEVKPKNVNDELLEVYGIHIVNKPMEAAELAFVKVSTSALLSEAEELKGGKLTQTEFDKLLDPVIKWVNRNAPSTVKAVFNGEQEPDDPFVAKCRLDTKYTLSGAIYSIYYDEAKTKPLTKNGVPITFSTDSNGYASLSKVPIGEYYIFEEEAPVLSFGDKEISYNKETKPIKVVLSQLDKDVSVARLLIDDMGVGKEFIKTDIFTGELVPNCTFEITNSDGEVIVTAITDEEGKYQLNLDWFEEGETYFYKEISAPGIYDLNTEPHEFKIEFDENGQLIKTEVENRRKTRDLLIRKTDAETGELLQGCVFTIAMVNEDGTQKVNAKTGEPIYLVEKAVTDENGEYYIEDAPMGTYMFTEITPPEGYELDEDLTGYTFTLDENSPELTIFEVTNTGDIAVIALACIAVVSIVGITLVIRKNRKLQR